ncbi:MAG: cytidylate kinase-like family protein [Spirochaetaceae bacterium]|jgi:cytidylate kinase|nr:cytidylate kinase-like family protein [Spirochaetaceae bacterium]
MAIITISRELASLSEEVAQSLAKQLNFRFVDRKTVEDRMLSLGVSQQKLQKYDERKPTFFTSLSQDRDDYLHYLKSAIIAEAQSGNCVFLGRGAFAVLKDVPGLIPVFLLSNMEKRIERVKSYFHCEEKNARQIISSSDHDRTGFHKYFFDTEWKDPHNYQITLNTSNLHPQMCAQIIENMLKYTVTEEINTLFRQRIKDISLAQSVIHHVLYEKHIPVHFLEATVKENNVLLFGVANSAAVSDAAVSAAKEVPSIENVSSEIQVVHEYSIIP